ncbi:DUF4258 domain-containing protein [Roseofilum reptotaenium CS-1145]|uniref:DUF4258 domain-containing protein n=1 Tax=Roseofilum reptotaenium AO1-A TaxID=1925591 RepID=A0A1L9QTU6_9CYAN|nr:MULTISPECIES: DUF4258 domain-containing protein [Roseofilum]MBP0028424.1 DUF4258 domain-containing protein [Roseofilum sp. Guam]MDB9519044.1 DUF4258 domain-containing protein [Roseofilum reptotaenium CS-1145]OJJ26046.1 hypothetical protein BI308_08805 [Roseofilum reptotaenium AO1-A]
MQIVWTKHAEERQQQWSERFGITREEVEAVVTNPQQIILEDDVLVAQVKRGNGLLRVPFVEIGKTKRILTLYWTNQIKRYWQENSHES